MEKEIIKGNKKLAEVLGVHPQTVQKWRKIRLLEDATIAEFGRVILYDLEKVLKCLHHKRVKAGRRTAI